MERHLVLMETTAFALPAIFIIVPFFALFSGLILWAILGPRHRARTLAASRNWSYAKKYDAILGHFDTWPFHFGRVRNARDVMTGSHAGHRITLFNYRFGSSSLVNFSSDAVSLPVGGSAGRHDPGIFAGADLVLGVTTGATRNHFLRYGSHSRMDWGICVMEMPARLSQVLLRNSYQSGDSLASGFSIATGAVDPSNPAPYDVPTGDPVFDKDFVLRAEDPATAVWLFSGPTRAMFVANAHRTVRYGLHVWTWDRCLFTLDIMPLNQKRVDFNLWLMASIIDNAGR